jgi:FAD/FMN-containing dehydrogenase
MIKGGILFPRPSALIADKVAKQFASNFKVLRSIKQAVDPKNIMNPGKLGL